MLPTPINTIRSRWQIHKIKAEVMKIQYSAKEQNLDTTAIASACLGSFSWVAGITLNYKFDEGSNSLCQPLIMLTLSRCSINIPTLSVN